MLKNVFFGVALIWTIVIACLCLISFSHIPKVGFSYSDKYAHFVFYFVFAGLWFLYFNHSNHNWSKFRIFLVVFFLSLFYGIAIELMQDLFTETRRADIFDVLANTFGTVMGLLLIRRYQKHFQKIKI